MSQPADMMGAQSLDSQQPDPADLMPAEVDDSLVYWGQLQGSKLASAVHDKQRAYFESARKRGLLGMWIVSYAAFHGLDPNAMSTMQTQQLGFDGDEAEFLRLCINIVRTYIQRQASQGDSQPPTLKCKAQNNDVSAQLGAKVGDTIVQYVFTRGMKDQKLRNAKIVAGVLGAGYCHQVWDPHAGDMVTVQTPVMGADGQQIQLPQPNGSVVPATHPTKKRSGAPRSSVGYPWTVMQEPEEQDQRLWGAIRVADNRWNLASVYAAGNDPQSIELRKKIVNAATDDEFDFATLFGFEGMAVDNKDACTTIHWYHARCAAMPEGRYCILLGDLVLWDGPCPVSEGIPIAEMCPAKFITTTFGYAPSWDLLAIQQALNEIVSAEVSNLATYGHQSVAMEKGTEITVDALATGQKGFFYPQGGKPPQAVLMNDIGSGPQVLKAYLHKMLDDVSGQNAAARGDPDANVKSGQFAALLHTIANDYLAYWNESEKNFIETIANQYLDMVRLYGTIPFTVEMVGIGDRSYMQEFTQEDVQGYHSVTCESVPSAMMSYPGRLDMHNTLKDYAPADRAAVYKFLTTGRDDEFMENDRSSQLYIERENEMLLDGMQVEVHAYDDPFKHCPKHESQKRAYLASKNPDPAIVQLIDAHIAEHAVGYGNLHPLIALFLGIQPPPPQLGTNSFKFAADCAVAQLQLTMIGQGAPQQPMQGPPQPQPGEAGSKRPKSAKALPAQGSQAGEQPSTGTDSTGVQLPPAANPPPAAQAQAGA